MKKILTFFDKILIKHTYKTSYMAVIIGIFFSEQVKYEKENHYGIRLYLIK